MEDKKEPLLQDYEQDQEDLMKNDFVSKYKDLPSIDVEMSYLSDFSHKGTSCLYKSFYPLLVILYYLFCCCFCFKSDAEPPRKLVAKRFKRWIKRRGERKRDPLDALLKLYAREEGIVEELEEIRLNPDFTSIFRNDLEFYLPQLCSYCLFEDDFDDLKRFIIIAAQSNIFFSHRVLFFLESLMSTDDSVNENIQSILATLSQTTIPNIHKYRENGQHTQKEIEEVIENYKKTEILSPHTIHRYRKKICASDITLEKYCYTMGVETNLTNENGYLSTPFFVFSLTNLCNIILNSIDRESALFEGLQKINMHLPASVYIPFVNASMRNYVVLHINVMEAKVFVTKERAPFLVCVEVFRPQEKEFREKIDQIEDSSSSEDEEELLDIEMQNKSTNRVATQWKNFLIKSNVIEKEEKFPPQEDNIDSPPKFQTKHKSHGAVKDSLRGHLEKRKPQNKRKFDIMKTLFKKNKLHKEDLIKKIDKFADEKFSHLVSLKKIKKHDPFSDFLDFNQPRSMSRTFTGDMNSLQPNSLRKLSDAIDIPSPIEFEKSNSHKENDNLAGTNLTRKGKSDEHDTSELVHSPSCIGDFYEGPIIQKNSVIVTKGHLNKPCMLSATGKPIKIEPNNFGKNNYEEEKYTFSKSNLLNEDDQSVTNSDEDIKVSGETATEQERRIRKHSIFGHLKTWKLLRLIVKSGDDLRQEQFAMQLICQIDQIFKKKKLNIWLKTYEILATGKDCGLIEFLSDAISIDALKKKHPTCSLDDYFKTKFTTKKALSKARDAFARSLAGYSLACYILQIKDRHNGNILLDSEGHIMHIDFGFLLTNAPGKGLNFEQAPFKLTDEFIEVLEGPESKYFKRFRQKLISGFSAIQKKAEHLICLVEMMIVSQEELDCFYGGRERVINELRSRLFPFNRNKVMSRAECREYVDQLIDQSSNNWRTKFYDGFQKCCQGIAA
ncbi:unnamed protein product [Moneuplotes crassus]|uniref:1-phosphatidylinositol 4-kinase n=1 Tax=Euplotes crassus TaxID=5936 RepID=A0AAD1Y2Q4_EUPCR|nr:unnamed protein product [Moneuplotes crassus]